MASLLGAHETTVDAKRNSFAVAPVAAISGGVVILLLVVSGRYGYHRDELYFLAAGRHLAWGYPDQPPFAPLLARVLSNLAPGSVSVLRIPSALATGATVALGAASARELGAGRSAQTLAAAVLASGGVVLGTGHLLSTATFDLLAWAVLVWLILRLLRGSDQRLWLAVGVVAGVGVLDSDLVAFLLIAIGVGLVLTGPRPVLRSPWLWIAALLAAMMWAPYLVWQAQHSWPELTVSRSIAAGHSGTSQPRALLVPEQLVLLSPYLAPVWIAGLVRLFRDPGVRWCRSIGVAWVVLAVVFTATGGKSYYLAGLFPVTVGAGAQPVLDWVRRAPGRLAALTVGIGVSLVAAVLITLPVVPVGVLHRTPIVSVNYDTGETVGWPTYVAEIAAAYDRVPEPERAQTAIVASNYGEAGAVDHYGPALGLPRAYGVQNGYWYRGPPPALATHALAIGFSAGSVERLCASPALSTRLVNSWNVKNDEEGAAVWFCGRLRGTWAGLWPTLRVIG